MNVRFTEPFQGRYKKLPAAVKKHFEKQIGFLRKDIRHPSLRSKKFSEAEDIWQARVNGHYRFYFQIRGDAYYILNIRKHRD